MNSTRSRYPEPVCFGRRFTGRVSLDTSFVETEDRYEPRRRHARRMLLQRRC
jgi:hypothetical protein